MVAYNFQAQFADDVVSGAKRQTIRANGKRRHARRGEALQLYTGQRTTSCRKLRDTVCADACPIRIEENAVWTFLPCERHIDLDAFAKRDGFPDWPAMRDFFAKAHGLPFTGTLIRWIVPAAEHESIACQIRDALDAATHENGYPHEYERPAEDIVLEIHDWSGLEGFDPENAAQVETAVYVVFKWRIDNPRT